MVNTDKIVSAAQIHARAVLDLKEEQKKLEQAAAFKRECITRVQGAERAMHEAREILDAAIEDRAPCLERLRLAPESGRHRAAA